MAGNRSRSGRAQLYIKLFVVAAALIALGLWGRHVMQAQADAAEYDRIIEQKYDRGEYAAASEALEKLIDTAALSVVRAAADALGNCYSHILAQADRGKAVAEIERILKRHEMMDRARQQAHEAALLKACLALADHPGLPTVERARWGRKAKAIDADALSPRHEREIELAGEADR